jgi:hypothetical protein
MQCLRNYPRGAGRFEVLCDLVTDRRDGHFLHGYNAEELTRDQVNVLIKWEHLRLANDFEGIYEAEEKYKGYMARVRENEEFLQDWRILKRRFPRDLLDGKIVLREEGASSNSNKEFPVTVSRSKTVFKTTFNFFCWKWFLDGMEGDEPIVAKLSFDITPFGTVLFIPGYWNFDPKRDIKWSELLTPHRSRGLKRQGEAFEPNRLDRERKERMFLEAESVSRALNESRGALILRCIRMAGLSENTEHSYIEPVPVEQSLVARGWDPRGPDLKPHEMARRHGKGHL